MNKYNVSICMATYNGISYIRNQVNSILPQLINGDELIISDDGSIDGTFEYVTELAKKYPFVRVYRGPHKGPNANFFYLFTKAKNEIILISDQDDIWNLSKVELVRGTFKENKDALVVLHRDIIQYVDSGKQVQCVPQVHGVFRNLIRNSYSGHRMAFNRKIMSLFLEDTEMCPAYDQYIGLLAEREKSSVFLVENLDIHLMHGKNISKALSIKGKIEIRYNLFKCLLLSKRNKE